MANEELRNGTEGWPTDNKVVRTDSRTRVSSQAMGCRLNSDQFKDVLKGRTFTLDEWKAAQNEKPK